MKTKFFSLILAFAFAIISCIPVSANDFDYDSEDTVIVSGDVTFDDVISTDDVIPVLMYLHRMGGLDENEGEQADIIRDRQITVDDAVLILKIACGIEDYYPKEYTPWYIIEEATCGEDGLASTYCITDNTTIDYTIPQTGEHMYFDDICIGCGKEKEDVYISVKGERLNFGITPDEAEEILGTPTDILETETDEDYITFTVYTQNPKYLMILGFTECDGLSCFYTTKRSAELVGSETTAGMSALTQVVEEEQVDDCSVKYFTDNIGTGMPYAVLFTACNEDILNYCESDEIGVYEKLVFYVTNSLRAINGLSSLSFSNEVSEVAKAHSDDMALKNYVDHQNTEGEWPDDRLSDAGITFTACGENICAGFGSPFDMVNGWYNSQGHRDNILISYYTHMGVGISRNMYSRYRYFSTQNFVTL